MEVNKENFKQELLPILQNIANATYVTFDLEMSGITTRTRYNAGDRSHDIGKPSLQQQYEENRQAAETFQILQVGITCVEEDQEKEFYMARPYNFPLSPLSASGADIKLDRTFAFSSSACDFLKGCGFDFGKIFSTGVPYLSQQEEYDLRDEFERRSEHNKNIPDLVIPPDDTRTLKFFREARKKITDWVKESKPGKNEYLNISNEEGPLNGFQRRLIYQLVRGEFPGFRVFGRNNGDFMQIEKLDEKKEAEFQKRASDRFNAQLAKQKGLRWIYEALTNGDLDGINPAWFCDPNSEDPETESLLKEQEFATVKKKLKTKTHFIVGHNLFADLIFLYRTFVRALPRTIKHFQEDIHEAFPFIIDTKFLATHGDVHMQGRSNLKELLTPFKKVHLPLILLHEEHTAYGSTHGKDHEAGFDSWMTAELFLKLAVKLNERRESTLSKTYRDSDTEDDQPASTTNEYTDSISSDDDFSGASGSIGGVKLVPIVPTTSLLPASPTAKDSKLPTGWHVKPLNPVVNEKASQREASQWMPGIDSAFWDAYANKLRVNASDAGVCDLGEHDAW